MACEVELLCVGNELLLGKTVNTNATWLAGRITNLGGTVKRVTTVRDDVREIRAATREILRRKPDFLITSGGLGPTFDDVTIQGVSLATRLRLRVNKEALSQIKARYREIFSSHRFTLTRFRLKMATFPVSAEPVPNPVGTAPGMIVRFRKTTTICLPGVPKELRAIFSQHIAPMIRSQSGRSGHISRTVEVSRVFESELAPLINRVMKQEREIYIKSHPQGGEGRNSSRIRLDFSYTGRNLEEGREAISRAISSMRRLVAKRPK